MKGFLYFIEYIFYSSDSKTKIKELSCKGMDWMGQAPNCV